ncbi:MFS transporter [Thermoplasma acidophilum]|nr:MFS transporter [Thermoplasma acidophilum]
MVRFSVPVLLPFIISSMKVDLFQGSLLITAYWIGYTVFQIPGGVLSDIFGTAVVNKISFAILTILFSLLYFLIDIYMAVFLIQLALGSVSALIYVSDASLVQKWSSRSKRSTALGIYQSGFFIGASIGEYFIISSYGISKFMPFLVVIPMLAITAILNIIFISDPKSTGKRIGISRKILFPAILRFSAGFAYIGFLAMFSSILVYDFKVPENQIFFYSWIPAFLGIVSSPLGGAASARIRNGRLLLAALPVLAIAIFMLAILYVNFRIAIFLSAMLGLLYGFYAGPSMSMASDVSSSDASLSSSSSILNLSSQSGGMISPAIMGYSYSVYGSFAIGMVAVSVISMALVLTSVFYLAKYGIT